MFNVSVSDINKILKDYNFTSDATRFIELQRYHYEQDNPDSKEVRLIIRVYLDNGSSIVMRFKNESDVNLNLLESQCRFAELLRTNGILSPAQYKTDNSFAKLYSINEYEVIVCIEEFVEGEIKIVNEEIAEKTGVLLAQTHNIAEHFNAHVDNEVLFDPFKPNDLFFFSEFEEICRSLSGNARILSQKIIAKYNEYMSVLSPLKEEPRYAVQGDISDCNLYQSTDGSIGIFDFNRSGDNNLYCDAVMQAIFEARLMDYPDTYKEKNERIILPAFLKGYQSIRPFSDFQNKMFPYLYTLVASFWSLDIVWDENSLQKELDKGNTQAVQNWLNIIWHRISELPTLEDLLKGTSSLFL